MMKWMLRITVAGTFLLSLVYADKLAVVTKVSGDVSLMKAGEMDFTPGVTMGTILEQNDKIKVGQGFAVMVLMDDKSQVKLRPNTEVALTVDEEALGNTFTVHLDFGKALSNYKGGPEMGFHVQTPTSVASVKGTEFWTISDTNGVDRVVVTEGFVDVENSVSGSITTAQAGETHRRLRGESGGRD